MKAAVVTFVRAYNYGAVLQCYALCKSLQKLGIEAETLDYYPEYFRSLYNFSYLGEPRYLPYRPIKNWLKFTRVWSALKKRNNAFDRFIKKNIPITEKQYNTLDELNSEKFDYDMYISGSDQVWSPKCAHFDPTFFLRFSGAEKAKKISYAASFGCATIPEEKIEEYKVRLENWDAYSVREKSGIDILNNLLGVSATQCCDPTLLLSRVDWEDVKSSKTISKPYILIYSVGNDPNVLYKYANELSEKKDLQVVNVPCSVRHERMMGYDIKEYGFKTISTSGPDEWLSLFFNAEYVLTDSFHGTVFSILAQKQFATAVEFSWGSNNRAKELLNALGLETRTLNNGIKDIDDYICWNEVDKALNRLRKCSLEYLRSKKSDE